MKRMLLIVALFFAIVFGIYGVKKALFLWYMAHYSPPPVVVSVTEVKSKNWHPYLRTIGSLKAVNGVDLATEVPGIVKEIRFASGEEVKMGEPLILLNTRVQAADLKNAKAALHLAELNYQREQTLYQRKASSKANLDSRLAEYNQAQAKVEAIDAQINERTISAPFAGRVGIRLVNVGQYVSPGTPLVTLQSLDPLYVQFSLPEQEVTKLYLKQPVTIKTADGKTITGTITALNAKVDETTRHLLVEATIPNRDLRLYPGMFASIDVWLPIEREQLVVPQTAISYSLSGDYVFLIQEEKIKDKRMLKAVKQYVKVGRREGEEAVVNAGLKAGDRLVTGGQLKLQNGTIVRIAQETENKNALN